MENILEKIQILKKQKDAVLLVHNYQRGEIQDLADHLGDSLELSRIATKVDEKIILFCGVTFMAETAKILSPQKKVLLPRRDAGCPMAEMVDAAGLKALKAKHPNAAVVTYVNSTAEVKAVSDVCCTSANAVQVVQNIEAEEIIFAPDKNLASWVQRFTDKTIIPWEGYCYVHNRFSVDEIFRAKEVHPKAVLMVHPECPADVADLADEVLSTGGMLKFARETSAKTILVGTEEAMLYRLKKENPHKVFVTAGVAKSCRGMKATHIEDVYEALLNEQVEITLPEQTIISARQALERMLNYA